MPRNLFMSQIYAFLTVFLWSSAYVFTKIALESFSFASLALLRCGVASLCLGAVLVVKKRPFPGMASLPWFVVSGVTGFALYILVFNMGSASLNPTTSCVIISTSPIITALLAQLFFKENLGPLRWIALALAFCGILVMTLWGGSFSISDGTVWMLAAAFCISAYNIMQRLLAKRIEPLTITAYSFFAGTLLLAPFMPDAVEQLGTAPASHLWLVIFLGACPSALAYVLWVKALSIAPTTGNVSNYMFMTPFLALLLEYGVTKNLPGFPTFAGGGIIMASLGIFIWASRRA
ncbi:MAG: DMT family transporter [Desulfovibrio sp.]|uniref:DMT family transporter n=1 Tax=Desulfovibrio sp. TaxID=885 RepID=UPI0039E724E2